MLCFVVVVQSFIMNSHEVFIHIHQACFAGTRAIVRLPQCQWSKPDGYGKISQCTTTTKHSKAKTVCIFLGMYCSTACMRQLIGSALVKDNGLSPMGHQAIIWTDICLLSIEPIRTNFSENFSHNTKLLIPKFHLKIASAKWRPFCPGGNELNWPTQ